jgi:S1-C subfamily serine protease
MYSNDPFYPPRAGASPSPPSRWPALLSLLLVATLLFGAVALYFAPNWIVRWRGAEAETAYLKRQAELKAESEAADARLNALNSKIKLISLGFRDVAKKVLPSVVNVSNEREIDREAALQLQGRKNIFYDYDQGHIYLEVGVGSGIIVKPGLVLTNNHVVEGASRLRVTFASGNWVAVNVDAPDDSSKRPLTTDPLTDLAVIRLPEDKLRDEYQVTAAFADDKNVQVGDWAIAVGSPLGLQQTVTHGIISAKGRSLSNLDMVEVLQTDAPINPGNSGGPLFNQLGEVIGINVAIASKSGGSQGLGFAIPSNTAKEIFAQLETGEVVRGYLGIGLQDVSDAQMKRLGLGNTGGIIITEVRRGSAAARANLQVGDLIVSYDQKPLPRSQPLIQLRKWILGSRPGSQVKVEVVNQGTRRTAEVTVDRRPNLP